MRFTVRHACLPLALLSGCAARVQTAQPGPDHPASPAASEAPLPPRSQTLAGDTAPAPADEAQGVVPPQVHQPGEHAGAAGGHDHAAMPGMSGDHASRAGSGAQGPAGAGNTAATSPAAGTLYACPMHPEVTSTNPNGRCPKCGMTINKPVKAAATAPAATPSTGNAPPTHQHDHGGGSK